MDPRLLQLQQAMAQRSQGGGQPQAPQQQGPSMGGENPFQHVLDNLKNMGAQGAQQPQVGTPAVEGQDVPPMDTEYNKMGGIAQPLTGAISNLQNAIKQSTDPKTISLLRQIIVLTAKVLEDDHNSQSQSLDVQPQ